MAGTQEREGLEMLLMFDWIHEEICPSLCTVGKPSGGIQPVSTGSLEPVPRQSHILRTGY